MIYVKFTGPNDTLPLVVGYMYQLGNTNAGQWIQITGLDSKFVYAVGVGKHQFSPAPIPRWRFDDLVAAYLTFP